MINENSFDKDTVDIFTCDEEHLLNSVYFVKWIRKAASYLRHLFPEPIRICIVIDNATLYNELCDEAEPLKRSWRKVQVERWLNQHKVKFHESMKKLQLLELAFHNLPSKKFKSDEAAAV